MKHRYLALGLSVVLAFSLVSCGRQQVEQEPQAQRQEVQQVEPATTEPITSEVKPAGTVAAVEPEDIKPEEQGEEPEATEPETTPEEKPEETQSAVPVQESKPQETQKPVEQTPVQIASQDVDAGEIDTSASGGEQSQSIIKSADKIVEMFGEDMLARLEAEANTEWDMEHVNGNLNNLSDEEKAILDRSEFIHFARRAGWSDEQIRHALGEEGMDTVLD